jgi:tripartite-type tricarboxylate transporter receptor subunit TctC
MEGWKHGIIVVYREGASGRIGWSALAKAKPDGYSIGFAPSAMLISAVAENAPYGHDKLSFVFNMMTDPGAIGVVADSPYKTLGELVADAKKRPGEVSVAVTSTIGQEGLTLKLIEKEAGCKFNIIPFDGESGVFAAIVGKHVDAFCLNVGDTTALIQDGKIRVLATGNTERSSFLPDVPTYKEAGYDVIQVNMRSVAAPAGVPEPIRQYLENCFLAAAEDPEIKAQVASLKIPVDTKKGPEVKQKFADITKKLQALWKEAPWQ